MEGGEKKKTFSFGMKAVVPKRARIPVANVVVEKKDFVEGFEGGDLQSVGAKKEEPVGPLVIPLVADTWKTGQGKRRRLGEGEDSIAPSPSPRSVTEGGSEASPAPEPAEAKETKGIGVAQPKTLEEQALAAVRADLANPDLDLRREGDDETATRDDLETRALRADLQALPTESDNAYSVPIDQFGEAMLRGMGWEPGKAIGRAKSEIEPYQLTRRPGRLGLGGKVMVTAEQMEKEKKRIIKPGETRKHKVSFKIDIGGIVCVVGGKFHGHLGRVLSTRDPETYRVLMRMTNEEVSLPRRTVYLNGDPTLEKVKKAVDDARAAKRAVREGRAGGSGASKDARMKEETTPGAELSSDAEEAAELARLALGAPGEDAPGSGRDWMHRDRRGGGDRGDLGERDRHRSSSSHDRDWDRSRDRDRRDGDPERDKERHSDRSSGRDRSGDGDRRDRERRRDYERGGSRHRRER